MSFVFLDKYMTIPLEIIIETEQKNLPYLTDREIVQLINSNIDNLKKNGKLKKMPVYEIFYISYLIDDIRFDVHKYFMFDGEHLHMADHNYQEIIPFIPLFDIESSDIIFYKSNESKNSYAFRWDLHQYLDEIITNVDEDISLVGFSSHFKCENCDWNIVIVSTLGDFKCSTPHYDIEDIRMKLDEQ